MSIQSMGTEWSLHKANPSDSYEKQPPYVPPSEVSFLLPPTIYYRKSVKQEWSDPVSFVWDTMQLCWPSSGGRYYNFFLTETSWGCTLNPLQWETGVTVSWEIVISMDCINVPKFLLFYVFRKLDVRFLTELCIMVIGGKPEEDRLLIQSWLT